MASENFSLSLDGTEFEVVKTYKRAAEVIDKIAKDGTTHALDFETTALRPDAGVVRLTCICGPAFSGVIDHFHAGPFKAHARALAAAAPWAVFNAGFEGRWFDDATEGPDVVLHDVGIMHKAKFGGGGFDLARLVKLVLGKVRDNKDLQVSDWGNAALTDDQYIYGFEDAKDTFDIFEHYQEALTDAQWAGFLVINDAWRGTAEMEDTGFTLDIPYHEGLIRMWTLRRDAAYRVLRQYTPDEVIPNLASKKQLSDFLRTVLDDSLLRSWPQTEKTGQLSTTRQVLRQASFRAAYPFSRWTAALMVYNRASKYLSTYGENLINKASVSADGRLRGRFNIAQAITGRYSSSNPNLQNIPRSPVVRRSFVAPEGAVLVLADYSGIELRVLAEMSGDAQLKQDVIFGNVHAESAITLYRLADSREDYMRSLKDQDHPHHGRNKELRSKAKAFSFQLTYGAGNGALALVLRTSDDEAAEFVKRWAERYPDAYNFRFKAHAQMESTGFLTCQSGRTIFVHKNERSLPVAANYPIQGSAGDVMYRAITRLSKAVWQVNYPVQMLATVHDELLLLTTPEHADAAKELLEREMRNAWLDIFPDTATDNLVEAAVGNSWAAKA